MASPFEVGRIYNRRQDLHGVFGGQWQSGIITPSGNPMIFLITGESGSLYGYHDEFRPDGTYSYTGEGQRGDMQMVRGNRAVLNHREEGRSMHLFEDVDAGLKYVGAATYLGHHIEERPDIDGKLRDAIVFELDVTYPDQVESLVSFVREPAPDPKAKALWKKPLDELRQLAAEQPPTDVAPAERKRIVHIRSEAVRVYVLRRANGTCEACHKEAPFVAKDKRPYLEPHHIRRVADGGPDHPRWVAAVCPNCHRQIHHGMDGEEINRALAEYLGTREQE